MSGEPSSPSDSTLTPVCTLPPSCSSSDTIARLIEPEPPSATGQPYRWAAVPSATPIAEDIGEANGRKAWAATPAHSARAGSEDHRRPSTAAGIAEYTPNRPNFRGCDGT